MQLTAPAKLNLTLHITGRRDDGYHLLESVVVFTQLADRLTLAPADRLSLAVTGPFAAPAGDSVDNLVLRAARALQEASGRREGAAITLDKQIPVGAGLGGGSADAAATLRGLNDLWHTGLDEAALMALAAPLGADVPMCLLGRPLVARGIGDQLEPLPWAFPRLHAVLVHPRIPLLTAQVYALRDGTPRPAPPPADWQAVMGGRNDLQRAAIAAAPVVGEMLLAMETAPPKPALVRMTGSGACGYALFDDADRAATYAAGLRAQYPEWWIVTTPISR